MKKYSSIIYIVGLACAGLIFTGCATNQPVAATAYRRIQVICSLTGSQISGAISALSCLLMARMWEALPRAEVTVATCRQASTPLPSGLIPTRPVTRPATENPDSTSWADIFLHCRLVGRDLALVRNQGQTVPCPIK